MSDRQYQHLKSALASAQMEGFENNETVEYDCIRLLEGEISIAALVEEILNRPTKAGVSL
ncbi:MAG: hypothetical protein R3Y06_08370 [Faecalibacterium sp.]